MEHRIDTLAEKAISWSAGERQIEVRVSLTEEMFELRPNEWRRAPHGLAIDTEVRVDGGAWERTHPQPLSAAQRKSAPPDAAGTIGPVGLRQERWDAIQSARAEVEQHQAWQDHLRAKRDALNADRRYQAHTTEVERNLTLGGRTY